MSTKCPVSVKQGAYIIQDTPTEFIVVDYGTHCFVQITQVGKVGKLVKATRDKPDNLDGRSTYSITNLLGAENEKVDLLARQIVEELNRDPPYKTLLLSYSCHTPPSISTVVSVVKELGI